MDASKAAVVLVFLISVLFMFVVGPFFTIWSVNALFGTEIAYTFKNWVAIVWLTIVINGVRIGMRKQQQQE